MKQPHLAWVRAQPRASGPAFRTEATSLDARQLQEAMALTCGMLAMVDDAVGDVLETLEEADLAEDTILVFGSDHGDYLGDHGLVFKGGLHYQSLIRVPFLWSEPGLDQPATVDALTSTIDLAPTVMARAGLAPYAGVQGLDLSPLIRGDRDMLDRETLLVEEDTYFADILGFSGQVRIRTLVTGRHRLSVFHGADWGELYDLREDPREIRNLWEDPAYRDVRQGLLWQLTQSMIGYAERSPWPKQEA